MISIITAAAFALAWFGFRYERRRRWRSEVDSALGALEAVHYGIVEGEPVGWGERYFSTVYTPEVAESRAREMADTVMKMNYDQIFVVPPEPLARLATLAPRAERIDRRTVALANFALWRVEVFNQLVRQLTDFYTAHCAEIFDPGTPDDRRKTLAEVVYRFSYVLHQQGIGEAGAPGGWYQQLIEAVKRDIDTLDQLRKTGRWQWLREPFVAVDALAIAGVIVVSVAATLPPPREHEHKGRALPTAQSCSNSIDQRLGR